MSVHRKRSGWSNEDAPIKISCRKACTVSVDGRSYGEVRGECCVKCMKREKTSIKDPDRRRDARREKRELDGTASQG